ncbi:phosphomevalonate kinase [Oceanobacillus caeni]|uniref:phosphomevalonate kinase n=1 Tax=Oceanobacillus caeni TaxID=405946 RepID=UPI002E1B6382|nr:phosphomevalonate kinase [Oceanobacillus caeni]
MNKSISIKTPGKLMIAGEYAVLHPSEHLAVLAVNRFVYADIKKSTESSLTLSDFQLENMKFTIENKKVSIHTDNPRISFVQKAMTIASTYLQEKGVALSPFQLTIRSELDDKSGIKYGLGSSAAVVTSVITAMLKLFLPEEPSKDLIFRLAALSHVIAQKNGSGADVAASTYGGILNYASFQAEWLLEEYNKSLSISSLLERDWTYFSVEPLEIPEHIYFCVGWTGKAASTAELVDKVLQLKLEKPKLFEEFLENSRAAVRTLFMGLKQSDESLLYKGVKENRKALAKLGRDANAPIETPMLAKLCDLAEKLGGAGKPSGAGGGDCGIAFMPTKEKAEQLLKVWEENGIKPLSIKPNHSGATEIKNNS